MNQCNSPKQFNPPKVNVAVKPPKVIRKIMVALPVVAPVVPTVASQNADSE